MAVWHKFADWYLRRLGPDCVRGLSVDRDCSRTVRVRFAECFADVAWRLRDYCIGNCAGDSLDATRTAG